MSQVVAEQLATIAMQQRRRGLNELAEITERMADKVQHQTAAAAIEYAAPIAKAAAVEVARLHAACDEREAAIMLALETRGGCLSAAELGAIAHVDPRKARAIVAHLRADHQEPILATSAEGYWIANHPEEADHTIASLESRRLEIERAIAGIKAGIARRFGTMDLFDTQRSGAA